ncbi:MAG: ArsR family transcriptional regulator [Candidatus Thermoplasmatota archaeon]
MADKRNYELTPKDRDMIDILTELGMTKNIAKTLTYISNVDQCRSADIEHGANLRQPEVSMAMQELRDKGWIKRREKKKKGKGRPVYLYKLTSSMDEILSNLEKEKTKEINEIKKDISQLKELLESR